MQVYLKELEYKANIHELKRRGFSSYLFCQLNNKQGYIVGESYIISQLKMKENFPVILKCSEKIPLWKQSMNLQMGKSIQSVKTVSRVYNARVRLDEEQVNRYYSIWQIV